MNVLFRKTHNVICLSSRIRFASTVSYEKHCRTLRLKPNASKAEIKEAYIELSKKFHPDRNQGSKEATLKFTQIKEAYDALIDWKHPRPLREARKYKYPPKKPPPKPNIATEDFLREVQKNIPLRTKHRFVHSPEFYEAWNIGHIDRVKEKEKEEFKPKKVIIPPEIKEEIDKYLVVSAVFGFGLLCAIKLFTIGPPEPPPRKE